MQHEKICIFNSAATTSRGYHELFLAVPPSSPLHISNQKGRNLCPKKACCTCVTRLSHPYVFPARFPPSINTHTFKWLLGLLFNISNFISQVFLRNIDNCSFLYGFKELLKIILSKWLDCSIWGGKICRLHLGREVRSSNECPGYGTKLSDGEASGPGVFQNMEYPFIAIAPKSTLTRSGSTF